MAYISQTPAPPYDAVVFTSINAKVDHTEHAEMFRGLVERASIDEVDSHYTETSFSSSSRRRSGAARRSMLT